MLLESVLAELSIYDLSDHRQQIVRVNTQEIYSRRSYSKTPQGYNVYKHRVVLEMYSPSDSSGEQLKNSEEYYSSTKQMTHLSEEYYSSKAPPECVPFRWPRVSKSGEAAEESRGHVPANSHNASAIILPPSISTRTSSASPKEFGGYFSWNLSHLHRESIEGFLQGENMNDYQDEDIIELNAHEAEFFPMSGTLEPPACPKSPSLIPATNSNGLDPVSPSFNHTPQSHVAPELKISAPSNSLPALCIDKNSDNRVNDSADDEDHSIKNSNIEITTRSFSAAKVACTNSLWGVFSCSSLGKCFAPSSVKQMEKDKQPVSTTMRQDKDSKLCCSSQGVKPLRSSAKQIS